ncbi:hypothetical protein TI03_01990, partial [Achromatium sp. WMS1]
IVTEYMQIKPKVQYAETDQLVHMINGPHWIKSVGLQAWLKSPMRIKLLANVQAHYEVIK